MSFDRQTEKAAEDLSDLFDAMIRMCGFVFENLRSDKLPGGIGFFRCRSTFLRRRRESVRTFFPVFTDPFAEGTFPDSEFPCDVFGLITVLKIEFHSLELVGRRITGLTPIQPSFRAAFISHLPPCSEKSVTRFYKLFKPFSRCLAQEIYASWQSSRNVLTA